MAAGSQADRTQRAVAKPATRRHGQSDGRAHAQSRTATGHPPNPTMQARGWGTQYAPRGGGFWGNVTSGLGMGAGFGVANALIGGIFNAL